MYGYLRDGYRDVGVFSVSHHRFANLMRDMAYRGAWRPALRHLAEAIASQTGIRDYLDGEKVVHAFLAAHFSLVGHYLIHSERELNKGYADLHLEPFLARYPGIPYGYVIEIKYLKRGEAADEGAVAARLAEASGQLQGYLADEALARRQPSVHYVGLAIVFHGWEMAGPARRWTAVSPEISPTSCCGRGSARCDKAYSLKPLRRRYGYAFSAFRSVRLVTAASPRPRDESW